MSTKRRFLPLLLLLSLTALFLYSYCHFSLQLFTPQSITATIKINPNFTPPPNFTLTIKLLAFDRIDSLSRCLRSLSNADYGADRVDLHILIDHFKMSDDAINGSSKVMDANLEGSHRILSFVDGFVWKFGKKLVHYRTGNVGLQAQWLEAWWPSSDEEFAFVVEDDLEVSRLFYKYLKRLIMKYYYDSSNFSPLIYGASLQRPRFVAGKHGNKLQLDSETRLFLYQMVGTWGQLLFPKPWKEFRLWYDLHKAKNIKPILQGMVTTGWYKKMGERIWTPWFIKFIHAQGYYNIYTNFLHERALAVSHRDAGVNYGKTAGPDSYLLDKSSLDFNLWEMQPLRNLKWYDFCFNEVHLGRIVRSFNELGSVLNSLQTQKTVVLVSLYRMSVTITRNLVCHFERLGIQNYIFLGVDSETLLQLARRGHPVIDAEHLINDIRRYKLNGFQGSEMELIKEILVKAYVIKKFIESGFDSWVIDGNMIPISEAFPISIDRSYDFISTKDMEMLFVKSSPASTNIWVDGFIYKVAAAAANSLITSDSLSQDHRHFGHFAAKSLEENGVKIKRVDELSIGAKIDMKYVNQTILGKGKEIVFWSSEMTFDIVQRRLEDLEMWVVDGDSSCVAVVCHKS